MSYHLAISSMSLGRAWAHTLPSKLDQAAAYSYRGVEIFYEDLEYLAASYPGGSTRTNQLLAAAEIRSMCDARNLTIVDLQPFMHYEGLLDASEHARRIEDLKFWFQLAKILRTDIIQIPSSFLAQGTTGDRDTIVRDLREVADLGARENPPIKFAYEALCWGKWVDTWEQSWDIVEAVDRVNFGICLDTFNICGREWADPSAADGKVEGADERLGESLRRLKEKVDVSKVFFVQVVDAERLRVPMGKDHAFYVEGQPARMSWSRNCRLFPFERERGGYLPILDALRTICGEGDEGIGYKGWISFELFSRSMAGLDRRVPEEHARRGRVAWEKMVEYMGWEDAEPRWKEEEVATVKALSAFHGLNSMGMGLREVAT